VPTSEETKKLAQQEGIPLVTLAQSGILDATVDGADEVGTGLFLGMADTVLVEDRRDFRMIEERKGGNRADECRTKAAHEPVQETA